MKKTETKISSVRSINDPSLAIKIKRHPVPSAPMSNSNKVRFNMPSVSHDSKYFSLPVAIPEEGLRELEIPPKVITKPQLYKPIKKKPTSKDSSNTMTNEKKENEKIDSAGEIIHKLTTDIRAIEDKLSKVEGNLSKNIKKASNPPKSQINILEFKPSKPTENKSYNASDYIDDSNATAGYPPLYDRNSYASELQKCLINPVKSLIPLPQQYPIDYNPKAAVSAIRNELKEWRKTNTMVASSSEQRNEITRSDILTATSEENTVSRDTAEKDLSSLESRQHQKSLILPHAKSGCNTTSALFKQGKKKVVILLMKNEGLLEKIKSFFEHDPDLKLANNPYGGRAGDAFDKLGFDLFFKAMVKSYFNKAYLPPLYEAAR